MVNSRSSPKAQSNSRPSANSEGWQPDVTCETCGQAVTLTRHTSDFIETTLADAVSLDQHGRVLCGCGQVQPQPQEGLNDLADLVGIPRGAFRCLLKRITDATPDQRRDCGCREYQAFLTHLRRLRPDLSPAALEACRQCLGNAIKTVLERPTEIS